MMWITTDGAVSLLLEQPTKTMLNIAKTLKIILFFIIIPLLTLLVLKQLLTGQDVTISSNTNV
ncbi:MAG: hypothetical protein Q9M75_00240, partial [Ghiorsea sp.]|nr:hypothetical protein [Ghiorsea sp.]